MLDLCAKAIGLPALEARRAYERDVRVRLEAYDPFHNDAQAMALVKRLNIDCLWLPDEDTWVVGQHNDGRGYKCRDLNRAIVECAAKMQRSSDSQGTLPDNAITQ
jgi:hypothetical protein